MGGKYGLQYTGILWCLVLLSWTDGFAEQHRHPAPQLRGQKWLNFEHDPGELRLEKRSDHVVVLVFFVAGDTNSVVALQQAERLHRAYQAQGLRVIGVHSPPARWRPLRRNPQQQNEHAPNRRNIRRRNREADGRLPEPVMRHRDVVQALIERERPPFPILIDHDRALWTLYGNRAYPAFQLIYPHGEIHATYIGTQSYRLLSRQVDDLLSAHRQARQKRGRNAAVGPPVF